MTRSGGKATMISVSMREAAAMQVDEIFGNRQTEARALFRRLDRVRALAERRQHNRYFLFWNTGSGVLDAHILAAGRGPADLDPDFAALRSELDGIRQQVKADLPRRPLVCPQPRHVGFEYFVDFDAAIAGAQFQ